MEEPGWEAVEQAVSKAVAMHFDGCHKIYLSMDQEQVHLMESYGYATHKPDFSKIRGWYDVSCGLCFIDAVHTNGGFVTLIAQGWGDDVDDEDDYWDDELDNE